MAFPLILCTHEDVFTRFGGQEYITQAIDPSRAGNYSQAIMTKAILDASEEVAAYSQVQVDLTTIDYPTKPYPQLVVTLTAQIAVMNCWKYGAQGRAVPEPTKEQYARAIEMLGKISRREVAIGGPKDYPAQNQVVTNINFDDQRDPRNRGRITYKGFLRYFC